VQPFRILVHQVANALTLVSVLALATQAVRCLQRPRF
jgi:hypothetical protein